MILLLIELAQAQVSASWDQLHDALWLASDGQYEEASRALTSLVRTLPGEDPARSQAMYHLGRLHWLLGRSGPAEEVLREGVRTGACGLPCRDLLGHIAMAQAAVRQTPTSWTFDDPSHGVFHPWEFSDRGTLRTLSPGESSGGSLQWSTNSDARYPDYLVVAFLSPSPPVREIRMAIRAQGRDAYVRLEAVDDEGLVYSWGPAGMALPIDQTLHLKVDLERLLSNQQPVRQLNPQRLATLRLVDSSAEDGDLEGRVDLLIDEISFLP